jgi:hypothetical protein
MAKVSKAMNKTILFAGAAGFSNLSVVAGGPMSRRMEAK